MIYRAVNMELANLVCKFGDSTPLLGLLHEVVLPAFLDTNLSREFGHKKYFFQKVKVVNLTEEGSEEEVAGIAGRFIKDTELQRDQVFDSEKNALVRDSRSLQSSPSALFVLILNNHRLIYANESRFAPSTREFRSTLKAFLTAKHKEHINSEFERRNTLAKKSGESLVKKRELYEEYPRPRLELVPLTSEGDINDFMKKFSKLTTLEILLSERNDESDNEEFFEDFNRRREAIGSERSVLRHTNSDGLEKAEAAKEIAGATSQGNQVVKLKGVDQGGDKIQGNNENFKISKPIKNLSRVPEIAATSLYGSLRSLVADGLVTLPKTSRRAKEIVASLLDRNERRGK